MELCYLGFKWLQTKEFFVRGLYVLVFQKQKISYKEIQKRMVWTLPNPILSSHQYYSRSYYKQIWPQFILININEFKPYRMHEKAPNWKLNWIIRGNFNDNN